MSHNSEAVNNFNHGWPLTEEKYTLLQKLCYDLQGCAILTNKMLSSRDRMMELSDFLLSNLNSDEHAAEIDYMERLRNSIEESYEETFFLLLFFWKVTGWLNEHIHETDPTIMSRWLEIIDAAKDSVSLFKLSESMFLEASTLFLNEYDFCIDSVFHG